MMQENIKGLHDQDRFTKESVTPGASLRSIDEQQRDVLAWMVLVIAVASVFSGIGSGIGVRFGAWSYQAGRGGFIWSAVAALLAVILALGIGWFYRRKGRASNRLVRWTGLLIGAAYILWFLKFAIAFLGAPAIHDVSTALADPPQFTTVALRSDNLDAIPGIDEPEMRGLNPQQRWVLVHQDAYGDIRSVRLPQTVAQVVEKADRLAKARGWDVMVSDPGQGRLEATDTSTFFGLKDDVVLRVKATEGNDGSIVDMRSVSRVGQSDLGRNAKRVRNFLADLSGTVTAQ
jgi:uncharacterized protein (DUF1499 family)